jgi:hypothetical protein
MSLRADSLDQAAEGAGSPPSPFFQGQLTSGWGDGFLQQGTAAFEHARCCGARGQARSARPPQRRDLPQRKPTDFSARTCTERLQSPDSGVGAVAAPGSALALKQTQMVEMQKARTVIVTWLIHGSGSRAPGAVTHTGIRTLQDIQNGRGPARKLPSISVSP